MKLYALPFLLSLMMLTVSCKWNPGHMKLNVDTIEITVETESKKLTSVLVDSSRNILVRISDNHSAERFYKSTLTDDNVSTLNKLIKGIETQKYDSIQGGPSKYTIAYYVDIKTKEWHKTTLIYQDKDYDVPYKEIYALVEYLTKLANETTKFPTDTTFYFNSLTRLGRVNPEIKFNPAQHPFEE